MTNWFAPPMEGEVSREEIFAQASTYLSWDHEPDPFKDKSTGYEDLIHEIEEFTPARYAAASDADKAGMVEEVLGLIREINAFPITYMSDVGIDNEILRCLDYTPEFKDNTIRAGAGVGSPVCNFLFPNIFSAYSASDTGKGALKSTYGKFYDDDYIRRAITFCWLYSNSTPTPSSLLAAIRLNGSSPTNFRPMNAKAIYERFTPQDGTIYDFSTGFGGRLLGAMSSRKNFRYVGTDPNTETMYNMHRLVEALDNAIPTSSTLDRVKDRVELHCCGSEVFFGPGESVDFAFSSPPYFDLEIYSDEASQSVNKFPQLDGWLEGFARGTIRNIVHMLKSGSMYAVNIADFDSGGKKVNYVDAWSEISAEEGAPRYDTIYLGVNARAGSIEQKRGEMKKENIMIFRKK